jgi:hypothetical protein
MQSIHESKLAVVNSVDLGRHHCDHVLGQLHFLPETTTELLRDLLNVADDSLIKLP